MLKFLLCMTCCNVPKGSRETRGKNNNINQNVDSNKVAHTTGNAPKLSQEKDHLLYNQIQAHIGNYGSKNATSSENINTFKQQANSQNNLNHLIDPSVSLLMQDVDSITASTSALLPTKSKFTDDDYTRYTELNFDDKTVSPPSSIDIDQYKESPEPFQESYSGNTSNNQDQFVTSAELNEMAAQYVSEQQQQSVSVQQTTSKSASTSVVVASSTKIGDYAQLEYSPIEDLESITTKSLSRYGSQDRSVATAGSIAPTAVGEDDFDDDDQYEQDGGDDQAPISGLDGGRVNLVSEGRQRLDGRTLVTASATASKSNVTTNTTNTSRRSSRGIESTSISIASQLSNEQLQQNLTNMIESANSPTALFGTIGLPLGPMLDMELDSETRKTSPETPGAALTSASQDSLSGNDYGDTDIKDQLGRQEIRVASSTGAALIGADSNDLGSTDNLNNLAPLANVDETELSKQDNNNQPQKLQQQPQQQLRNESALSMTTTTSDGFTNPTPTPSELSSGTAGETKKKSRLRPKNLLKRFKSSKKNKTG